MPTLSDIVPATNAAVLALAAPFVAATSTSVNGVINDTAEHVLPAFTPQLSRKIRLTLNATAAASGVAQLLRSIDGGTTMVGITKGGNVIAAFEFTAVTGVIFNEAIDEETETTATYYLSIHLTAGTVTVRLAQ